LRAVRDVGGLDIRLSAGGFDLRDDAGSGLGAANVTTCAILMSLMA